MEGIDAPENNIITSDSIVLNAMFNIPVKQQSMKNNNPVINIK